MFLKALYPYVIFMLLIIYTQNNDADSQVMMPVSSVWKFDNVIGRKALVEK